MKGKTISITLPEKVVSLYDKRAKEIGMSRSSIIGNIIIADYELKKSQEKIANVSTSDTQTENS